jgi:glycosyltransferase involved in cell wall biosynthesis
VRIIYLHQFFNTLEMTGSTRSFEFGRRLVAAGHSVDVITSFQEPTSQRDWFTTNESGINVHWLPVKYSNRMNYSARVFAFFEFAIRAAIRARHVRGDVVFATSTPLTIAIPGVYAARRRGIPMVFEVRDLWPDVPIAIGALKNPVSRFAVRALERFSYANSAAVIALSPGMAQGVLRTGYPPEKVTIVPNAADLDLFRRNPAQGRAFRERIGIDDSKILVGYLGTLGRLNGISYLVRIAAALKDDQRFVFLTAGDGLEYERVSELARAEGVLGRNFLMLSKVAKMEVPALFSAVDVATSLFLPIPEMEANSANKFFDALAAGCCVAINYGGWHAQLLREANAGIRLDADPRRAAAELQALADEPGRIQSAGANARKLAEDKFSRDELAAKIHAVLAAVVQ